MSKFKSRFSWTFSSLCKARKGYKALSFPWINMLGIETHEGMINFFAEIQRK